MKRLQELAMCRPQMYGMKCPCLFAYTTTLQALMDLFDTYADQAANPQKYSMGSRTDPVQWSDAGTVAVVWR